MNNLNRTPKYLKLRDGGQPLPGAAPGPLAQGPTSSQFWGALGQGVRDTAAPMVQEVQQFHEDYPAVAQVAQLASSPLNVAAGVYGTGKALLEGDNVGAVTSALGAIPVLGKYAGQSVLAGTRRSIGQFQQVNAAGMRPSMDMVGQAVGRMVPDAGTLIQANELGQSTYGTAATLRGRPYGGN